MMANNKIGAFGPNREMLNWLYNEYQFPNGFKPVIQESYLRIETPLSNSGNTIQFPFLVVGGESNSEKKLDKNDLFAVRRFGMFLGQRDITGTSTHSPNFMQLQSFPNNEVSGTGVTVRDLQVLYNGFLNIIMNTVQIFDGIEAMNFLFVPVTQQDSISAAATPIAAAAAASPVSTYTPFRNQWNMDAGFFTMTNLVVLSGAGQTTIQLTYPTFQGIAIQTSDATKQNLAVLRIDGFLIKNVAYNV